MTLVERLHRTGIRRLGSSKRGFRYVAAQGRAGRRDRERIAALRIPPAWGDVAVSRSPRAEVQAVGKDAAGRWQYRYSAAHVRRREQSKYRRIVRFGAALPRMRRAVQRDLARPGLGRDKVLACVLRILATCFMRPGSRRYARQHGSYGLATIRRKHVTVKGDLVRFEFAGKSGQRQRREMRDRRVASIVRACLARPGHEVFKFEGEDGRLVDVRRRHINEYIKRVMGRHFSAKDFRTWAGTLICAYALARAGANAGEPKTVRKKKIVAAVRETADRLGNTPAICRASYIYPSVLTAFERGHVVRRANGVQGADSALLDMLQNSRAS